MKLYNKYVFLMYTIIVGQLLDIVTTYYGVKVLGYKEVNPLMSNLINLGWEYFIIFKLLIIIFALVVRYSSLLIPTIVAAISIGAPIWNIFVLLK